MDGAAKVPSHFGDGKAIQIAQRQRRTLRPRQLGQLRESGGRVEPGFQRILNFRLMDGGKRALLAL